MSPVCGFKLNVFHYNIIYHILYGTSMNHIYVAMSKVKINESGVHCFVTSTVVSWKYDHVLKMSKGKSQKHKD